MKCGSCKYCNPIIDNSGKDEKVIGLCCSWNLLNGDGDGLYICGADDEVCEAYKERKHD